MSSTAVEADRPPWIVPTQALAIRFFDVNRSTFQEWLGRGCPGSSETGYDLQAIMKWKSARNHDPEALAASSEERQDWRQRKLEADTIAAEGKAELLRMEVAEKAGELVSLQKVVRNWNIGMLRVKSRLEATPDEMQMTFPAETRAQNYIDFENLIERLLTEMASWGPVDDV